MIIFLTSIRNPLNATSFEAVERLFERTLRSVCSQQQSEFLVIVVCNSKPRIAYSDSRVIYHVVDFPPPSIARRADIPFEDVLRDKGSKLLSGFLLCKTFNPTYVFIFDADDLVSRRVGRFLDTHRGPAGWYVNTGYILDARTNRLQRTAGLVRYCGTSLALDVRILLQISRIDRTLTERSSQSELLNRVPLQILKWIIGDHKHVPRFFADHGYPLRQMPFAASAWVIHTGENISGTGLPEVLPARELTRQFRNDFPLVDEDVPTGRNTRIGDWASEFMHFQLSRLSFRKARMLGFPRMPHEPGL